MANALTHAAQRKVFEVAMDNLAKSLIRVKRMPS